MPKEANTAPVGVTRKRVTRRTTTTTVRKRAGPMRSSPRRVARKAPTPIASQKARKKRSGRAALVVLFCAVLTIVGSIWYGISDEGVIDPAAVIAERNARVARGEAVDTDRGNTTRSVPVQQAQDARPNGGGRGMGDLADRPDGSNGGTPQPTPKPEPESASTTASSSESDSEEEPESENQSAASSTQVVATEEEPVVENGG